MKSCLAYKAVCQIKIPEKNDKNQNYEITEKDCQNFDKQTSSAILSAVEEYKQYTKQQKEASTCIENASQ